MKKTKKGVKNKTFVFKFTMALAVVSIIGFLEIATGSFFGFGFGNYIEFLWLVVLGTGFILQSKPKSLTKKKREDTVTPITSLVVGCLAVIAGLLSLPFIGIMHPVFLATKGVISVIAIIFIVLETWVLIE
ncbi:hypothetical protein HOD88_01295 [archaeon]|jgi:hypothetical protein|nr:hypothetical protein [archaeon]